MSSERLSTAANSPKRLVTSDSSTATPRPGSRSSARVSGGRSVVPLSSTLALLLFSRSKPLVCAQALGEALAGGRLAGALGAVINTLQATLHVPHAEPAQRLGLPGARPVVGCGQASDGGVTAQDQVSQSPSGEVGDGYALPGIAARGGDAARRVIRHRGHPVAGHRQRAAPGVGEPSVPDGWEPPLRRTTQHLVGGGVTVVLVLYARAVAVGCAAAAEEDAPVGSTREVVHGVAVRSHALAPLPPDLLPLRPR